MIRLAHLSDLHFDEKGRLDDLVRVLDAFAQQAVEAQVDAVVIAGDFYERRSTPDERAALASWLYDLSVHYEFPVYGVRGNHDAPGDLALMNYVLARGEILDDDGLDIDRPRILRIGDDLPAKDGSMVRFVGWPWVERAWYAKTGRTPANLIQEAGLRAAAARRDGVIPVLVAHVEVAGYATAAGHSPIGSTVAVDPALFLADGCDAYAYVALGHIHKAQDWHQGTVAYCGAPSRSNFGEPEPKGWLLVEIDPTTNHPQTRTVFQSLPAREIVLHEIEREHATADSLAALAPKLAAGGALVRLRVHLRPEDLVGFDRAAVEGALRVAGAADAKVEIIVEHEQRVRAGEIATAASTWDKVVAYFGARGALPDDATLDRLRSKLDDIEREQAAA